MPNITIGKIWSLDTTTAISSAGVVTTTGVCIDRIRVRFTTVGVGSCIITDCRPDNLTQGGNTVILDLKTTAATTVAAYFLDAEYSFGKQTFMGLLKTVMVNVDTIYVVTSPGA